MADQDSNQPPALPAGDEQPAEIALVSAFSPDSQVAKLLSAKKDASRNAVGKARDIIKEKYETKALNDLVDVITQGLELIYKEQKHLATLREDVEETYNEHGKVVDEKRYSRARNKERTEQKAKIKSLVDAVNLAAGDTADTNKLQELVKKYGGSSK